MRDLELPDNTLVIAITRDGDSRVAMGDTRIRKDDEVFLITEEGALDALEAAFLEDDD